GKKCRAYTSKTASFTPLPTTRRARPSAAINQQAPPLTEVARSLGWFAIGVSGLSAVKSRLRDVHDPIDAPFFAPVMIAVTFEAASLRCQLGGSGLFVTLPAEPNAREIRI